MKYYYDQPLYCDASIITLKTVYKREEERSRYIDSFIGTTGFSPDQRVDFKYTLINHKLNCKKRSLCLMTSADYTKQDKILSEVVWYQRPHWNEVCWHKITEKSGPLEIAVMETFCPQPTKKRK